MNPIVAFFGSFGFYILAFVALGFVLGRIVRRHDNDGQRKG
jgi:hypothetical protein